MSCIMCWVASRTTKVLPAVVPERIGEIIEEDLSEPVDGAQRRAQIMRD